MFGPTVVTEFIFATLMLVRVEGQVITNVFHNNVSNGQAVGTNVTAVSKLHCASKCSKNEICLSFEYYAGSGTCEMSNRVLSGPSGNVFMKDSADPQHKCRSDQGYRLWKFPGMTLCLNYQNTDTYDVRDIQTYCTQGGGHLTVIDSAQKGAIIADIFEELNAPMNEKTYIEGRKTPPGTTYFSETGIPLTWFNWSPSDSLRGGEDCIIGKADDDFLMITAYCAWHRAHFLCEIDL